MERKNKPKLNYRFHDPNPPGVTADFLVHLFAEVNAPKVEAALRAAAEEAAAADAAKLNAVEPAEEKPATVPKKKKSRDLER